MESCGEGSYGRTKSRSSVIMPVMLNRRRVKGGGRRDGDSIMGYQGGWVLVFIRFYGLEKRCHAYRLALEQMARTHTCTPACQPRRPPWPLPLCAASFGGLSRSCRGS